MKLQIRDVSKKFGDQKVLEHVSMDLESGHIYCLMAPSGKGKTTLFRILMGLEDADAGSVTVFTQNAVRTAVSSIRISAVFQEDCLCEAFSPVDNVLMTADSSMDRKKVCQELRKLLPEECLDRSVSTLSGGQKRRVAVCRALCAPFDLLILDEPFTGLDDGTRRQVLGYVQKKCAGKLTLLSTHQEEDIQTLSGIRLSLP